MKCLCSAAGWTLSPARLWTNQLLPKIAILSHSWVLHRQNSWHFFTIGSNWDFSTKNDKICFFNQASLAIYHHRPIKSGVSRICSKYKLWIYRIVKKPRYKKFVSLLRFMWKNLHIKSFCWFWFAGKIVDWVVFSSSKNCLIKVNLCKTLSSKAQSEFILKIPVMWCQLAHIVRHGNADQS